MPVRPCPRTLILAALLLGPALAAAQATPPPAAPPAVSGDDLLRKVDQQANAFKDATFQFKMRIICASQGENVKTLMQALGLRS